MPHSCEAIGCTVRNLSFEFLMCRQHWQLLPYDVQTEVLKSWDARKADPVGGVQRHTEACAEAVEVVALIQGTDGRNRFRAALDAGVATTSRSTT